MRAKWIQFSELPPLKPRKTKIWLVEAIDGNVELGEIKWIGRWRCYGFYPREYTIYNSKRTYIARSYIAKNSRRLSSHEHSQRQ